MLFVVSYQRVFRTTNDARLTLKLFHDIQKLVVNFWSFPKPVLDEIQVGEGVGDVERSSCAVCHCRSLGQHGQLGVLADALDIHNRVEGRIGWLGMATLETGRSKSRDMHVTTFAMSYVTSILIKPGDHSRLQISVHTMPSPQRPPPLSTPSASDHLVRLGTVTAALAKLNIKISVEDLLKGVREVDEASRPKSDTEASRERKSAMAPCSISDN